MNKKIRVLLADDHPVVRAGLSTTLSSESDIEVVGEAADGEATLQLCHDQPADVLLLDLSMPGPSPIQLIKSLQEGCPELKVLVLTAYDNDAYVRGLVEAGVSGYVLKDEPPEVVVEAIRATIHGGRWFSAAVIDKLVQQPSHTRAETLFASLTEREQQVLERIARGWDNARIAADLHLAEQTVRNYASRIYDKIGVSSRAEAIIWAREREISHL